MFRQKNRIHFLYLCVDVVLIVFSFFLSYYLKFNFDSLPKLDFKVIEFPYLHNYLIIFIFWGVLIINYLHRRNLYATDRALTIPKEVSRVFIAIIFTSIIVIFIVFFVKSLFFSRFIFVSAFLMLVVFLSLWRIIKRILLRKLIENGFNNFNVLVIGANNLASLLIDEIQRRSFMGLKIAGVLSVPGEEVTVNAEVLGKVSNFESICRKHFIDEVFIASAQGNIIPEIIKNANRMHLGIRVLPPNFEDVRCLMEVDYLGFLPFVKYKERKIYPAELTLKRIFDFISATILIILILPLFLVIAILIKLDSKGPIFYTQKRMGRKGEIFSFFKFRSMVKDADKLKEDLLIANEVRDGIIFKIKRDPRITGVGRVLRRYSLDELPQLINVLKGDMSLVGPRPFPVEESRNLEYNQLPRLNIKPGLTGLAQIRGRSDLSFSRWVKWDLWYINNWSFMLDLKIIWLTIPAVFRGKGAY